MPTSTQAWRARQVSFEPMRCASAGETAGNADSKNGWESYKVVDCERDSARNGDLTVGWEGADNPVWMIDTEVGVFKGK